MQQEVMKDECPHNLTANAEICPLSIPTHLPPEADVDLLKHFFSTIVEMDLERIYNISVGQIVTLLDDPKFKSGDSVEKWNAVVDVFVQGLLERRQEMQQDVSTAATTLTPWERKELAEAQARGAMLESMSKNKVTGQSSGDLGIEGTR